MKSIAALLTSWLLMGASCQEPSPPSAVEVKVAVPVPCQVPEPECSMPAFNGAKKEQEGDVKLRLLRAETVQAADCLRRYRKALAACRAP